MSVRAVPEIIRISDPPQWTPAELAAWEQFVGPSPDLLAALKAREIMAMRELARRNYRDFLKYWILVTRQRLKWAWFHDYLADLMQTVADRQRKRVIVNIPPRHLKSTLISQAWHAWMIGRDDTPNSALMSLAATGSLAARDSRRTLDILRADWYHVLFPHVTLTRENEVEWDTAGGAYRVAVGRGGTVTGKGGDHICIAGGTPVLTERGWIPIDHVTTTDRVATPKGFKRVLKWMDNGVQEVVRIRAGGFTLLSTPTHRCSTPAGWRFASSFNVGDEIHAIEACHQSVRDLRPGLHRRPEDKVLLPLLRGSGSVGAADSCAGMPDLRRDVHPPSPPESAEACVLQQGLPQYGEDGLRSGGGEPELQAREADGVQFCFSAPDFLNPLGCGYDMRHLQSAQGPQADGSPPHQREQEGRHAGEPSGVVRPVPSRVTSSAIRMGRTRVYDLTVEDEHCFYANGLLVHNCVDDLLLSDEASSETIREKCNEWLGETLASRLNDPKTGTITIIMQRFHERDPAGYILERMKVEGADQYAHIVLPMEAEKRTLVCLDGEVYKDRLAGDLLDPGRIGPQEVAALKASMRINYEGQYQQNPCKQAGGMLDPGRLLELDQTAAELISRFGLRVNAYLDFATREAETQRDDPDFSTIVAAARDQLGRIFLLDVFRKQCATDELARTLIGMQKAYNFRMVKGEKGGLINTFMPILTMTQRMTGCFFALTPYKGPSSKGDKVHRASSFQGLLNAGMICVPKNAHWLPSMQAEMRSFPNGAHDDIIDSCAMACNDALDLMEGEAPIVKPDDERTLMDQEHKAELARRIEVMRRGDDDGYQTDHDW